MNDLEFNKKYFPKKSTQLWGLSWDIELAQRSIAKQEEVLEFSKKQLAELQQKYDDLAKEIDNG